MAMGILWGFRLWEQGERVGQVGSSEWLRGTFLFRAIPNLEKTPDRVSAAKK